MFREKWEKQILKSQKTPPPPSLLRKTLPVVNFHNRFYFPD